MKELRAMLKEGTEIYYHGDMANDDGFGIVKELKDTQWGMDVTLLMEDERDFIVPLSCFSVEYSGNGMTRFVTKEAYLKYRNEKIESMKKEREALKEKEEIKDLMSEMRKEFNEHEIYELLDIDLPSTQVMKFNILGPEAPSIYDEEYIECRLCRKIFKKEAGFLSHIEAHDKNHFPKMRIEFRKEEIAELEKELYYLQTQIEKEQRKLNARIQKSHDAEAILRSKKLAAGVIA